MLMTLGQLTISIDTSLKLPWNQRTIGHNTGYLGVSSILRSVGSVSFRDSSFANPNQHPGNRMTIGTFRL